jgi:DNA mismatch repair ATPase MutS
LLLLFLIFVCSTARDDIMQGKSTFMIEMEETAAILNHASSRSLLVLDELGRGTSTNDGYAIAWAVLRRLTEISALTLFATHYHGLCRDFQSNSSVELKHVSFVADKEQKDVVFLYQLKEGPAGGSYGLNVAQVTKQNKQNKKKSDLLIFFLFLDGWASWLCD